LCFAFAASIVAPSPGEDRKAIARVQCGVRSSRAQSRTGNARSVQETSLKIFRTLILASFAPCLLAFAAAPAFAQMKVDLTHKTGASLACVGLGPAASLAQKCVDMFQQAGFIATDQLGYSGLTIGTTGTDDGVITAVEPDSAAAHAGVAVGDAITAVDGKSVKPTPGMVAAQAVFGPRGTTLKLTLRRAGANQDVTLKRAAQNAPDPPQSPSKMIHLSPLVNGRGEFIPCMGAGLAGGIAIDHCDNIFKPYGFIKTGDFGATGFEIDLTRASAAIITAVDVDSEAARAGIAVGDEIVAVDGQPLTPAIGEQGKEQIFGKAGAQFHVTIRRAKTEKTVVLTLAAKPA
jgi:membrane-associated protease RseP (regulator of RpoE activity)